MAVAVPEEALGHIELEGHEAEVAHEEHEAEDGPDKSTHVGEELVHLVEGSFVCNFRASFDDLVERINSSMKSYCLFDEDFWNYVPFVDSS